MDNGTHALAGLLLAQATVALAERRSRRPATPGFRRLAAVVGVLTAELPDVDVFYATPALGMGKLGYLLHHRGHTHTIVFAVAAAFLVWGVALALRRAARAPAERGPLLALALAGTLSHVALDYTNSYGVHPFWPIANAWHYGDAVFIVEPWLWVAVLPPLIAAARSAAARVVLGLALAGILAAAWSSDRVTREVAVAVTVGAALWSVAVGTAAARGASHARRVALGLAAWLGVEATFFAASAAARARVREAVARETPAVLADVVLNPAPGDALCWRALVVELDAATYRVATAAVAPFPGLRDVRGCGPLAPGGDLLPSARAATRAVWWGGEWSAPRAELAALAATNCEVAAALRFVRVPVWRRAPEGTIHLADLRYGRGGFASIETVERPTVCPRHVPPWEPPRRDVLGLR